MVGSIGLIADAWHTLSDSISSIAVIIGLRASKKPPDDEHPYGHGRAELVSTLLIGLVLALIGVNFFRESIDRLLNKESVVFRRHYGDYAVGGCHHAPLRECLIYPCGYN